MSLLSLLFFAFCLDVGVFAFSLLLFLFFSLLFLCFLLCFFQTSRRIRVVRDLLKVALAEML